VAPEVVPSAVPPEAIGLVALVRKELAGQGLDDGPHTIAWYLRQHHQVCCHPRGSAVT
jgi:hypothetical protein